MIEGWNMQGGNKPEASIYTHAYPAQIRHTFCDPDKTSRCCTLAGTSSRECVRHDRR